MSKINKLLFELGGRRLMTLFLTIFEYISRLYCSLISDDDHPFSCVDWNHSKCSANDRHVIAIAMSLRKNTVVCFLP